MLKAHISCLCKVNATIEPDGPPCEQIPQLRSHYEANISSISRLSLVQNHNNDDDNYYHSRTSEPLNVCSEL